MEHSDIRFNILYHLDIDDVTNLCHVDHLFNKSCTNPHFWKMYFEKHGLDFDVTANTVEKWINAYKTKDLIKYMKMKSSDGLHLNAIKANHFKLQGLEKNLLLINDDPFYSESLTQENHSMDNVTIENINKEILKFLDRSFNDYSLQISFHAHVYYVVLRSYPNDYHVSGLTKSNINDYHELGFTISNPNQTYDLINTLVAHIKFDKSRMIGDMSVYGYKQRIIRST